MINQTWWDDSPEAEAEFRESLLRLQAVRASNREIAERVIRSKYILALVVCETERKRFSFIARDPEFRTEWLCETVHLLGKACERRGMFNCDLSRPRIGGYWRMIVRYEAMKAARNLWRKSRYWEQQEEKGSGSQTGEPADEGGETPKEADKKPRSPKLRRCEVDWSSLEDKKASDDLQDLRLDLYAAIEELDDALERQVMKLAATGLSYGEIAAKLGLTYEQVRYAMDKAKEKLRKCPGLAA